MLTTSVFVLTNFVKKFNHFPHITNYCKLNQKPKQFFINKK